jgi:hypothetical protein
VRLSLPVLIGSAVLAFGPAHAQIRPDVVQYTLADFAEFSPQNALDMVRRTPGFTLEDGDSELRGFGGGAGNVLIDGVRPSSKTSVSEALAAIPASQVERIELIRNAATAEAQGQTLVLNVVRSAEATSGAWLLELEHNANGVVYPRAEVSRAVNVDGWKGSVRARGYWEEFPFRGVRVVRDTDGQLVSSVETNLPSTLAEAFIAGEARRKFGGGTLNVNGRLGWFDYHFEQPGKVWLERLPGGAPDQLLLSTLGSDRLTAEAGADYTRDIEGWSWKVIGLAKAQTQSESQFDARYDATGALLEATTLLVESTPLEAVVRATTTPTAPGAFKPEIGAEIAYNRLDSALELASDTGAGSRPIELPAANVRVEEIRGEAFANLAWTLSSDWTLEGGLAVETSEITVSGDVENTQRFDFVKPSVAVAWRAADGLQFRAGARRTVGQLDFADFAASADLNDETSAAGNPDLGPDQITRWYVSADWRGRSDLALNLELFQEQRSDVLELVLLPSGAPGLANAGDATVMGAKATFTLPLDFAIAGARLTGSAQLLDSEFDDPLIGRVRALSEIYTPEIDLEFRHDPPGLPLAWGLTYRAENESAIYYVDQIDSFLTRDYWGGFVETTAVSQILLRLSLRNADVERSERSRMFFTPDRSGDLLRTEERQRRSPAFVTVTASGQF